MGSGDPCGGGGGVLGGGVSGEILYVYAPFLVPDKINAHSSNPYPSASAYYLWANANSPSLRQNSPGVLLKQHSRNNILSGPVLRDTARLSQRYPPIARYGVFGVSTWPIGCDTPSPFSERFPLGEHAKWRCDTPPLKRGISAILPRYPIKTRQMGAIPPSAILSRKGIARYGGVSRTGPLRQYSALFPPCFKPNPDQNSDHPRLCMY